MTLMCDIAKQVMASFAERDHDAQELLMVSLTLTHLRFTVETLSPLRLGAYEAGMRLRGALGNVMRRAYCAGDARDHGHAAACPVCWLLAANEHPGEERRGYALVPPLNPPEAYAPGQRFAFGLTLFGDALRYLPYFILAVPEMGRGGIGPGRGQFALREVWAANPLLDEFQPLLAEGETLVRNPALMVTHAHVTQAAEGLAEILKGRLTLNFLTPTRLIQQDALLKLPDFGAFFARLLKRLDELDEQFAGGQGRPLAEVQALQSLADQVRLMETDTRWVELWSGSSRTSRQTPMGGFVGAAVYAASPEAWRPLLPWLIWGQAAQVGKDVVKGNGWYELVAPGWRRYGLWLEGARRASVSASS
jgi:hypothetical protein